jgi:hypothetical protein
MDGQHFPDELPCEGLIRIDVTGQSAELWRQMRPKLIKAVADVLEGLAPDRDAHETLWEGASELVAGAFDHLKARLAKAGLENARIEAEVCKLYAEAESTLAEARKRRGEAAKQEFDTAVRRLRLALGLTRAQLIGDEGEEAILFGKQIDAMLVALKEVAGS